MKFIRGNSAFRVVFFYWLFIFNKYKKQKIINKKQKYMKEIIYFLSAILSVLLIVIGMLWYSRETKNKNAKPNFVVMILWTLIAIINTTTYYMIVLDVFKSSLVLIGTAVNIYVLIVIIVNKNYILLKRDIWIVLIGSVFIVFLVLFTDLKGMHVIMQILNTLVYIPLIWGIYDENGKEPFGPWFIISLATVLNLLVVLINYSDYWSLIQPLRSLFLQSIVLLLIKYKGLKTASFWELFFYWHFIINSYILNINKKINLYEKNYCYYRH